MQRGYHCDDNYCQSPEEPEPLSTWCFWNFPPLELVSHTPPEIYHSLEHFVYTPHFCQITKDHPTLCLGIEGLK